MSRPETWSAWMLGLNNFRAWVDIDPKNNSKSNYHFCCRFFFSFSLGGGGDKRDDKLGQTLEKIQEV